MNSTESLLQQAARWHAIASGRDLSADETRSLDQWLAQNPRHRLAYADVCAAAFALEQSRAAAEAVVAPAATARAPRTWLRWSAAAGAPLLLALALLVGPRIAPGWQNWNSDLYTEIGKSQSQTLADGSVLELDTDSAVRVRLGSDRRDIELLRGRLAIAVAKDPTRPLHVRAGRVDAMAVGTRFVVDRNEAGTEVGVHEGIVRVTAGDAAPVELTAGQQAFVGHDEPAARVGALSSNDGWTRGVLSVEQVPLAKVLAELDRYLPERIVLADDAHAAMPITATLPLDDPAAALRALAQTSQLSLRHIPRVAYVMR
ncbi:MAG TPA: FecR domain-containing protein [Tahibacter sp.]|uniref:FecR family protein n=1 Tax=Tahibacter sp. TaxID=2056211 RepID=UPI002C0281DF|nr:FecR domain-containing protein [Tahibacter sp.]HSX62404.1 FecR domain-containing protein [Tahibacter sp.]